MIHEMHEVGGVDKHCNPDTYARKHIGDHDNGDSEAGADGGGISDNEGTDHSIGGCCDELEQKKILAASVDGVAYKLLTGRTRAGPRVLLWTASVADTTMMISVATVTVTKVPIHHIT